MPLTPDVENLLRLLSGAGVSSLADTSVQRSREFFDMLTIATRRPETTFPVGATEDLEVPGGDGPRPARLYEPAGEAAPATVLFLHGGGFVIGSVETHDNQARLLCRETGARVLSLDYRLAPEHPWPAAVADALAAADWVSERFGPYAVGGDSAGANLAAVVAQQRRGEVVAQFLLYPATDLSEDDPERYPSRRENGEGYFLTERDMRFFEGHYLPPGIDRRDPRLSPALGDLAGVAPAVVVTAGYDPLRDEGDAYAAALAAAGVPVTHRRFDGLIHGFFGFGPGAPSCQAAAAECCALFRPLLWPDGAPAPAAAPPPR